MNKGNVFILLASLFFSTLEIANKMLVSGLDSFQITFWIFIIGAILMTPLAIRDIKKREEKLKIKDIGYFAFCGIIAIPISMSLLSFAGRYTQASTSAVIFCSNALFTVPLAYLILKEKINKATAVSLLIGFIGVIVISMGPQAGTYSASSNLLGIGLSLASAITWSLFTTLSKIRIEEFTSYIFNCFIFYSGALVILLILFVTGKPIIRGLNLHAVLVLVYMGLFIKAIGYIFYVGAIRITGAVTASLVFLIKPALATTLAVIVLGDKLEVTVIIGIILIIISSYIAFKAKRGSKELPTEVIVNE